jgi:hypothetical protein
MDNNEIRARSKISVTQSKTAFTLDRERQCRALGHVLQRDFRHPNGEMEPQVSTDGICFRCGDQVGWDPEA